MQNYTSLLISAAIAGAMLAVERALPAVKGPTEKGWWWRALAANLSQIAIVVLAGFTWNIWLRGHSLLQAVHWPNALAAGVTYVVSTFFFYWWHRVRHESSFWWRVAHQIHHSASRLELFTTFYKHPFEIGLDSILSAAIVYVIMGCSPVQGAIYTVLIAVGEMFYHWNIHTPRWVGLVFQRPEAHRIHHQRSRHTKNYGDLPVWDSLFGTYSNPKNADKVICGFSDGRETQLVDMLRGRAIETRRDSEPLDLRPACLGCRRQRLCREQQI
jgi:sterol desaturase/sphingolipid hydroxylase (fatty acid hydroxylase superfamily)